MTDVYFSSVEVMLEDLEHDKDSVDILRFDVRSQPVNDGAVEHTFFASYLIDGDVYHTAESCGCDFINSDQQGTERATQLADMVSAKCEEMGIKVRHGAYQT